jgi:hypothetical protein
MTTDLEADLRREFDAATPPSSLTFHPESVLRQGNWTIRRRRLIAAGSAAMAVGLVAVGATVMNRPHNTAAPQPASHKATTGIVRAQVGFLAGTFQVEVDLDPRVESNVKFSVVTPDGRRQEVGRSSTGKPGQNPDATWGSGVVEGRPVTIGLVPSSASNVAITFADGASYGYGFSELADTGYRMFAVEYTAKARPTDIASIRWTGPTGIVDGIEGNHRLTGRTLTMSKGVSVEVVLRPGDGGTTTVFGNTYLHLNGNSAGIPLTRATADSSGAAVVTGRQVIEHTEAKGVVFMSDGPPIAAGILPPGAANIAAILTTGAPASTVVVPQRLPDGRVIFAVKAESAHPSVPSKDSIKAVTWTNADGTQGRKDVTQKQGG